MFGGLSKCPPGIPRAGRARCARKGWGVSERAAEVWRCNIMFVIGATAPITPHYVLISHGDKARLLKLKMRGRGRESVGLFRKEAGRSRAAVVHMSMERPAAVWRCILARHRATGRGAWIRKGSRSRVRRLPLCGTKKGGRAGYRWRPGAHGWRVMEGGRCSQTSWLARRGPAHYDRPAYHVRPADKSVCPGIPTGMGVEPYGEGHT